MIAASRQQLRLHQLQCRLLFATIEPTTGAMTATPATKTASEMVATKVTMTTAHVMRTATTAPDSATADRLAVTHATINTTALATSAAMSSNIAISVTATPPDIKGDDSYKWLQASHHAESASYNDGYASCTISYTSCM